MNFEQLEEEAQFEQIAKLMDDIDLIKEDEIGEPNRDMDSEQLSEDIKIIQNLDSQLADRKDGVERKRSRKEATAKRGGLKPESPFFDDDN